MKLPITFSTQARGQAREIARWWRENRPSARRLFATELRSALTLIAGAPTVGVAYAHSDVPGVRRILLTATRVHVYYVHDATAGTIEVVAMWSAVRGLGPSIKR